MIWMGTIIITKDVLYPTRPLDPSDDSVVRSSSSLSAVPPPALSVNVAEDGEEEDG